MDLLDNDTSNADEPVTPIKRRHGRRLRSPENVRSLVASTIRQAEQGLISPEQARLIFNGAKVLLEAIAAARADQQLEERIEAVLAENEQLKQQLGSRRAS